MLISAALAEYLNEAVMNKQPSQLRPYHPEEKGNEREQGVEMHICGLTTNLEAPRSSMLEHTSPKA